MDNAVLTSKREIEMSKKASVCATWLTEDTDSETLAEARFLAERLATQWRNDLAAICEANVTVTAAAGIGNATGFPSVKTDDHDLRAAIESALTPWRDVAEQQAGDWNEQRDSRRRNRSVD